MIGNLVDSLNLEIYSGSGGDGVVSYRRVRSRPRGVPDGGNGGRGGDVYFCGDQSLSGLGHFHKYMFRATDGKTGRKGNKTGENGASLSIAVPIGTRILDRSSGELLFEVDAPRKFLLTRGGKAGLGNSGSARQVATKGDKGTHLAVTLDYRLHTDIGIVGLPNAGKSTLLKHLTSAKPEIAAYPLTTKFPQVGVCDLAEDPDDFSQPRLTIVEIPALDNKKNQGAKFLKHILKCTTIVYVISAEGELTAQFNVLRQLLRNYDEALVHKKELVVLTKTDLVPSTGFPQELHTGQTLVAVVHAPFAGGERVLHKKLARLHR